MGVEEGSVGEANKRRPVYRACIRVAQKDLGLEASGSDRQPVASEGDAGNERVRGQGREEPGAP